MQMLTKREKSFWSSMLVNSFQNKGMMVAIPDIVADQTGATIREAESLLIKLFSTGLLVPSPAGEKVFDAMSNRMVKEYGIAKASYERYSGMGAISAEKNGTANLKVAK